MFYDAIFRFRLSLSIVALSLVLLSIFGLSNLRISTDNRIFYGIENPYFQEYLEFEASYASNDNILFVLHAKQPFPTYEFPKAIRALTAAVQNLDHVIRVDSLSNYPHPTSSQDVVEIENFLDWACPTQRKCRPNAEIAAAIGSAHLTSRLISKDKHSVGVLATVQIERGVIGDIERLHRKTREIAEKIEGDFPGYSVFVTGGVPMMAAFAEATASDLSMLLPMAFAIILVLLRYALGSSSITALIFFVAVSSAVSTLGLAGWAGHILNNATSIVPLIIFTLVTASSMHIAVHYSRGLAGPQPKNLRRSQARASITSNLVPIVASNATTAVSLLSLIFVDSPPLQQLGVLAAIGVVSGLLLTLILFPAWLSSTGRKSLRIPAQGLQNALNRYARSIEDGKFRYRLPGIVLVVSLAGLPTLQVDEDFVRFFDTDTDFRQQTDKATELLAGPNHIEVLLDAGPGTSVFQPEYVNALSTLTAQIRRHEHVSNVFSFSDILNEVSVAYSNAPLDQLQTSEELAQLFLLYELSLQQGQSNTDFLRSDHAQARISVLLGETSSADIQNLENDIYALQDSFPDYQIRVTGENIPVAHLSEMNIRSMLAGIAISLGFTALLIGLIFRDWNMGVLALLSTLVPVAAGFGIWGWIFGSIGLAATAIVALTIGIVVDDTVHLIYRFLDGRRRLGLDKNHASAYAIHRAGTAVTTTSVALVSGLSILLISNFEVNSTLGGITCLIIALALLFDLFVLPKFLARP